MRRHLRLWFGMYLPYLLRGVVVVDMPDKSRFDCPVCNVHVKTTVVRKKTERAHLYPCGHEITFAAVVRAKERLGL